MYLAKIRKSKYYQLVYFVDGKRTTISFARTQYGSALYFKTLKAAFSKAVQWEYLTENPFKKIGSS